MFVLDTNVVSELIKPSPDQIVRGWFNKYKKDDLFFTAIGEAELRQGLALKSAGKRRDVLAAKIEYLLQDLFAERILPFERKATGVFAQMVAARHSAGLGVSFADLLMAAIAHSNQMAVVTGNSKDFAGIGLEVINTWQPVRH